MSEIRRGEIWLANLNPTVGREQAGMRPVLIVSSNYFNQGYAELVFAIPITSKNKNIRSHIAVGPPAGGLTLPSFLMCEAMRSISKQRLERRLGSVPFSSMESVEEVIKILLDI